MFPPINMPGAHIYFWIRCAALLMLATNTAQAETSARMASYGLSTLSVDSHGSIRTWTPDFNCFSGDLPSCMRKFSFVRTITAQQIVSRGARYGFAIGTNGKLYGFGQNWYGELGLGHTGAVDSYVEVPVPGAGSITSVAVGNSHTTVLDADGRIFGWRREVWDESPATPQEIELPDGERATALAADDDFTLALGRNGKVYAWGRSDYGVLTYGIDHIATPTVIDLPPSVKVTSIHAIGGRGMAIDDQGRVYSWGCGTSLSSLDYASAHACSTPEPLPLPDDAMADQISISYSHVLLLTRDGTLYARGNNEYGQLGNGSWDAVSESFVKVALPTGVSARDIHAGATTSSIWSTRDELYSWGGAKHVTAARTPALTRFPRGNDDFADREIIRSSQGERSFFYSGAITEVGDPLNALDSPGGTLWWSFTADSDATIVARLATESRARVAILEGESLDQLEQHSISDTANGGLAETRAQIQAGKVYQIGVNIPSWTTEHMLLSWATDTRKHAPIVLSVSPLLTLGGQAIRVLATHASGLPVQVSTRDPLICPMDDDGLIRGRIAGACRLRLRVDGDATWASVEMDHLLHVSVDFDMSAYNTGAAIEDAGEVHVFYRSDNVTKVRAIELPTSAVKVSSSLGHGLALDEEGRIHAWGNNSDGALGDGTRVSRDHAAAVILPANERAADILAGRVGYPSPPAYFSLAIGESGRVFAWGANVAGQLGFGSTDTVDTPSLVTIPNSARIVALSSGGRHVLALDERGSVFRWGAESDYSENSEPPRRLKIPLLSPVVSIVAGTAYDYALTADRRLFYWRSFHSANAPLTISEVKLPSNLVGKTVALDTNGERGGCLVTEDALLYCISDLTVPSISAVSLLGNVSAFDLGATAFTVRTLDGELKSSSGASLDLPSINDNFTNRRLLSGTSGTTSGHNRGTTSEAGEPLLAGAHSGHSAWWRWQAPADGKLTIDLTGSNFDTMLTVYRGNSLDTLEFVAWNNDFGTARASKVTFETEAGVEYQISVDGYAATLSPPVGNTSGDIRIAWSFDTRHIQRLQGTALPVSLSPATHAGTYPLQPTLSSGLPVEVTALTDTVCSWADGLLTMRNHGDCVLRLVQHGDAVWSPFEQHIQTRIGEVFAAGHLSSYRVNDDNYLESWGFNARGNLADGSTHARNIPAPARGIDRPVVAVAAGLYHVLAIDDEGRIHAWGSNEYRQLGSADPAAMYAQPVLPRGTRALQIAAGSDYSLALGDDGWVYAWGSNDNGQLGLGTYSHTDSEKPRRVALDPDARPISISAGVSHALALDRDGSVHAWGSGTSGAAASTRNTSIPQTVTVPGIHFTQVSAGGSHSLALSSSGSLYGWGSSHFGAFGPADIRQHQPFRIDLGVNKAVASVYAGLYYSLVRFSDGSVWQSGPAGVTQLDNLAGYASFRQVPLPSGVNALQFAEGGADHVLMRGSDGMLYAWGANSEGQLGLGDHVLRRTPQRVSKPPVNDLRSFAIELIGDAGLIQGSTFNSGTEVDEPDHGTGSLQTSVWWTFSGRADTDLRISLSGLVPGHRVLVYRLAANGHLSLFRSSALTPSGGEMLVPCAAGEQCLIAVSSSADDANTFAITWRTTPVALENITISTVRVHPIPGEQFRINARAESGSAVSLENLSAETCTVEGDLVTTHRSGICSVLAVVRSSDGTVRGSQETQLRIGAGTAHGYAHHLNLRQGVLRSWGSNYYGQLGDGSRTDRAAAVPRVSNARLFSALSANGGRSAAIDASGRLLVWGRNWTTTQHVETDESANVLLRLTQQLVQRVRTEQTAAITSTPTPMTIQASAPARDVSLGLSHGLVRLEDGQIFAWGENRSLQLGQSEAGSASLTPIVVPLPEAAQHSAAGGRHSLAVLSSGRVYAWGDNRSRQSSSVELSNTHPLEVALPDDVRYTLVAAGLEHSLALRSDGIVFAWGSNQFGQLGSGNQVAIADPDEVLIPSTSKVIDIASGDFHSAAMTADGNVFVWGALLDENGVVRQWPSPVVIELPGGVRARSISAQHGHLGIADENGTLHVLSAKPGAHPSDVTTLGLPDQD